MALGVENEKAVKVIDSVIVGLQQTPDNDPQQNALASRIIASLRETKKYVPLRMSPILLIRQPIEEPADSSQIIDVPPVDIIVPIVVEVPKAVSNIVSRPPRVIKPQVKDQEDEDDEKAFWKDINDGGEEAIIDPVQSYFRQIGKIPLLTSSEEKRLGMAMLKGQLALRGLRSMRESRYKEFLATRKAAVTLLNGLDHSVSENHEETGKSLKKVTRLYDLILQAKISTADELSRYQMASRMLQSSDVGVAAYNDLISANLHFAT